MKINFTPIFNMSSTPPVKKDNADKGAVGVLTRPEIQKPSRYQVILLNDDYTPMDFVVQILVMFFNKSGEDATRLMMEVHQKGQAVCGVYSFEIAETKVMQVTALARQQEYPLRCTMEKKS